MEGVGGDLKTGRLLGCLWMAPLSLVRITSREIEAEALPEGKAGRHLPVPGEYCTLQPTRLLPGFYLGWGCC